MSDLLCGKRTLSGDIACQRRAGHPGSNHSGGFPAVQFVETLEDDQATAAAVDPWATAGPAHALSDAPHDLTGYVAYLESRLAGAERRQRETRTDYLELAAEHGKIGDQLAGMTETAARLRAERDTYRARLADALEREHARVDRYTKVLDATVKTLAAALGQEPDDDLVDATIADADEPEKGADNTPTCPMAWASGSWLAQCGRKAGHEGTHHDYTRNAAYVEHHA